MLEPGVPRPRPSKIWGPICSFSFRLTLGVISLQFGVLTLNIAKARDIIYLTGSLTSLVPGSVMCFSGKSKILFLPLSLMET